MNFKKKAKRNLAVFLTTFLFANCFSFTTYALPNDGIPGTLISEPDYLHDNSLFTKDNTSKVYAYMNRFFNTYIYPYEREINVETANTIIRRLREAIPEGTTPFCQRIYGPATVIGDLHGDIKSFRAILYKITDRLESGESIVFLGDYVDRGPESLKVLLSILELKTMFRDQVFLLRGNHEVKDICSTYGFLDECINRYDRDIFDTCNEIFNTHLSCAAIINDEFLCVHGGIPFENEEDQFFSQEALFNFNSLDFTSTGERAVPRYVNALLWNDPSDEINGFAESQQRGDTGGIYDYGEEALDAFLDRHRLRCLIRAHQMCARGYEIVFPYEETTSCLTVFSSSDYTGTSNDGAIAHITSGIFGRSRITLERFSTCLFRPEQDRNLAIANFYPNEEMETLTF